MSSDVDEERFQGLRWFIEDVVNVVWLAAQTVLPAAALAVVLGPVFERQFGAWYLSQFGAYSAAAEPTVAPVMYLAAFLAVFYLALVRVW